MKHSSVWRVRKIGAIPYVRSLTNLAIIGCAKDYKSNKAPKVGVVNVHLGEF